MMRVGFNSIATKLPMAFMSGRAAHSPANSEKGKRFATTAPSSVEGKTTFAASRSISDYANIFTREGDKVFIHSAIPGTNPPEKRISFVKLYMLAHHLIGNNSMALSDLTKLCNIEGYKPTPSEGGKTHKVQSHHLKTALESKLRKSLFRITSDEDGKTHVSLTDRGIQHTHHLADTLNSLDLEEPQGRLREVLMLFKKEDFLRSGNAVSIKKLASVCEKNGYSVQLGHLKTLISANFAKKLFIFDRDEDTVKLSPLGKKAVESLG